MSTYVAKVLTSCMRVPSSSSTVQGGPSSTTPVLLSCVDSFDTAPPPQDLLAGLLCTAPPPSTGDVLGPPCIRAGPPCPWSPWRLHSPWRLPSNHACYQYPLGLWPLAQPSLDLLWWSSSMTRALAYDTTDLGGICDINFTRADLDEICSRDSLLQISVNSAANPTICPIP
ncbi:uncharacterized protein UDID_17928 [Ustilago sp. UG-2017a]|nr:uncharacterized protein UDID_17928 [Ustilago sp. UG-2017a]